MGVSAAACGGLSISWANVAVTCGSVVSYLMKSNAAAGFFAPWGITCGFESMKPCP